MGASGEVPRRLGRGDAPCLAEGRPAGRGPAAAVAAEVAGCPSDHARATRRRCQRTRLRAPPTDAEGSPISAEARSTVSAVKRQCSRSGCSESAAVTLTFQYTHAQVWLDVLALERDPHAYDLCDRHANRLTAPQGWQVRDRRRPSQPTLIAV